MTKVPLGDEIPAGAVCRHGINGPICGAAATWHILVDLEMENVLACDEHAQRFGTDWEFVDRHPVDPGRCGINGSLWVSSETSPPGMCIAPELDAELAAMASGLMEFST